MSAALLVLMYFPFGREAKVEENFYIVFLIGF